MGEPRAYTTDETRAHLLEQIRVLARYWEGELRAPRPRQKLEGLAFSVCALLDGSGCLPGFSVTVDPHPTDKKYNQENGENWYPENGEDIAGTLHELLWPPEVKSG